MGWPLQSRPLRSLQCGLLLNELEVTRTFGSITLGIGFRFGSLGRDLHMDAAGGGRTFSTLLFEDSRLGIRLLMAGGQQVWG